jgi:hypothetical protein
MLKKNNYKDFTSILLASILIVIGLCVNGCGCGNNDHLKTGISGNDSGSNGSGISWQGLRIETDKSDIQGNKDFTVKIAADEYAVTNNSDINLTKFKIKAYIVDEEGGTPQSSQLKCTYTNGKNKTSKIINEYLTFEKLTPPNQSVFKYITFNVINGADVKALTVVLELLDESSNKLLCKAKQISWKASPSTPIKLAFNRSSRLELEQGIEEINNDQDFEFTIINNGAEDIDLKEVTIIAETDHGTVFSLNGQLANQPISIRSILPTQLQKLEKDESTPTIKLKLVNRNNQSNDQLILSLFKNGDKLTSTNTIKWKYTAQEAYLLIQNGKKHIRGDEVLEILGMTALKTANWDHIKLSIQSTNNVIFRINNKPFKSAKLTDFFPESAIQGLPLSLRLYNDLDGKKESQVTLILTKEEDGKIEKLDTQIIRWDNKNFELAFVNLEDKQISDYEELPIAIQNIGDEISTKDIKISGEVHIDMLDSITTGKGNKPTFYLNGKMVISSLTLQEVLGESTPRNLAANETLHLIKLHLNSLNTSKAATINLVLEAGKKKWKSAPIKWNYKNIKFSFQGLPTKALDYDDTLKFQIKNEGDPIKASEIILRIWDRNLSLLNFNLKVNEKLIEVIDTQVNLGTLLSTDEVLKKGEVVDIIIEKIERLNFDPHITQSIVLGLYNYRRDQHNKLLSEIERVTWNPRKGKVNLDVKLVSIKNGKSVAKDSKILQGNNKDFVLVIHNQGDEYIYDDQPDLYLHFKLTQGAATIKELQQQSYDDGNKKGYIVKLDYNTLDIIKLDYNTVDARRVENSIHCFQIANQKNLHICPLKEEKVEYEIQICKGTIDNLTPINSTHTTLIWEPKNIDVAIQIDKQKIKGSDREFKLILVNNGDILRLNDKDILQLKIERLENAKSSLIRSGKKIIDQNQSIYFNPNNILTTQKDIITQGSFLLGSLEIDPHEQDNLVAFQFTLTYIKHNGDSTQSIVMGTPAVITWTKD